MKRFHEIVLLLCMLAALFLLRDFLSHPRAIWTVLMHDRNGHYAYGQDMALALEKGNVPQFFAQLEKGKVWPPLHGLLVAATQLVTGNDWRVAVLPSLCGWIMMVWSVYYTAQKVSAPTGVGWAGGLIALVFAMISPGGRLYATDIMLESLGSGLTMASLACYARAVEQRDSRTRWRLLGIVLTLFFFEKYNYWMIVALSLMLAESGTLLAMARDRLRGINAPALLKLQLREPLNWLTLLLVAAVLWLWMCGPGAGVRISGKFVSLYPPYNIVTLAYAAFFIRVIVGIRRSGWKPATAQEKMLLQWHVLPVAASFLIPRRLGVFLWYLSPADQDVTPLSKSAAAVYYAQAFAREYSASLALAILAVALACVALLYFKKLGPGGRAVLICMVVGASLIILHPNQKSRFLHSWIPALWTAAGIGSAIILGKLPRRSAVAGVAVAAVAAFGGWSAWGSIAAARNHVPVFSLLDMSDRWLSDAAGDAKVAFCASQPARPFMEWTFLNRYRSRERFEWPEWQSATSPDELRAGFARWLAETHATTLVYLDVQPGSPDYSTLTGEPAMRSGMETLMAQQTKFKETKQLDFPLQHYVITIWRADGASR